MIYINKLIKGNWYAPCHYLENLDRIIEVDYIDTTSSAGDWSGYAIKQLKHSYNLIFFCQENHYPNSGFKLFTTNPIKLDHKPTEEEIYRIYDFKD